MRKIAAAIVCVAALVVTGTSSPTFATQFKPIKATEQAAPEHQAGASEQSLDQTSPLTAVWYAAAQANLEAEAAKANQHSSTRFVKPSSGYHKGYATAKECAANTENGGDYGRSNNPGHFGRYQFSRPTWEAHGGDPNTWGNASPEEQDRVFNETWDSGGSGNWTQWDGC